MSASPIGFIGLGNMGLPMARHLVANGNAVVACDARPAMEPIWRESGGQWAATAREVADRCDRVLVCLPTPQAVEQVAGALEGGTCLRTYIDLSTTGPAAARRVAARLAAQGVAAVDAPVSGGVAGAERRSLSVMLSGPRTACERAEPLVRSFGSNVFHVGDEAGMGQLLKLLNNLLSTTALAATYEALSVGVKAGLDAATMLEVLGRSSGTNHAIENKIPHALMARRAMGFALELSVKDVTLAVEAGEAMGVPMRFGSVTRGVWREALAQLGPQEDYLQVVRLFEQAAGVSLQPQGDSRVAPGS